MSERELDERIAIEIMGEPRPLAVDCTLAPIEGHVISKAWLHIHVYEHGDKCEIVPRSFSTNIAAAMEVVDRVRSWGVGVRIEMYHHYDGKIFVEMNVPSSECQEWGDTASEAICKCALKAQSKFAILAARVGAIEHPKEPA